MHKSRFLSLLTLTAFYSCQSPHSVSSELASDGAGAMSSCGETPLDRDVSSDGGPRSLSGPQMFYWSAAFLHGVEPTQRLSGVSRIFGEANPGTGAMVWTSQSFSTSFVVTAIAMRDSLDMYVAGTGRNGMAFIERWEFEPAKGRYQATRAKATTGVGVPAAAGSVVESIHLEYAPANESTYEQPQREQLYAGNSPFGHVHRLAADPEGRFLLVIASPPQSSVVSMYRIPLDSLYQPTLVFDQTTLPDLARVEALAPVHHQVDGRKYLLTYELGATAYRTVISDPNNDGVFDSVDHLDDDAWSDTGYSGLVWDNMVDYRP